MAARLDILILPETLIPALLSVLYIRKKVRSASAPVQESWQTVFRKKNLKSAAIRQEP
jgi:hypothetical protein